MKLLFCNSCRDIVKLHRTTRTCHCGESGGHYKQDGLNAIYYGPAIPLGFANSSFTEACDTQPEFGMGTAFTAFVIPKVCPTMEHVDSEDYESINILEDYESSIDENINRWIDMVDYDDGFDDMMERADQDKIVKKKIKNVYRDEE